MKTVIYVATYPSENYDLQALFEPLESKYIVIHPSYNWEQAGPDVQKILNEQKIQPASASWDHIIDRDLLGLRLAELMIYDADAKPGFHFLMAAAMLDIPIMAVSNSLESIPIYFASKVRAVIKPSDLLNIGVWLDQPLSN